MLVKFKVENWKSFHCLDFSAIASHQRRFNGRVPKLNNYRMRLLPIIAVFGGNASGKTNFFDALAFLQRLVRGEGFIRDKIDVKPFAFNKESREKPVSFEIEFLIESKIYHYELVVSEDEVLDEYLAEVCSDGRLKKYFEREGRKIELFGEYNKPELEKAKNGIWKNVLFLTNSVKLDCEEFRAIYDWFNKTLLLISPNSRGVSPFRLLASELLRSECGEFLKLFDVGFDELAEVNMNLEQIIQEMQEHNISKELQASLRESIESVFTKVLFNGKQDKLGNVKKLVSMHTLDDNSEKVPFELGEESDGTLRLLELLPVWIRLRDASQSSVVFIDELDRSMHHLLTRKLIETYLDECSPESRTQLFFTTHDALLLDNSLLRNDEMWLVEKKYGASDLMSVGDYKTHKGENLLRSYLRGYFGGIPNIRLI